MLEPDWSQERPSFEESLRIWDQPVFTPNREPSRVPDEFLAISRSIFSNGGVLFARFDIADDPRMAWFLSRNRLDEISFLDHLLTSQALRSELPQLRTRRDAPVKWEWTTPYTLDGELAWTLMFGGAYKSFEGSGEEAKKIGKAAGERLFDHRYEDVLLYKSFTPWSDWFCEIAWDITWVGLDKSEKTAWILCTTDTD